LAVGGAIGAQIIAHVDPSPFKLLLAVLVFLYLGSRQLWLLNLSFVIRYAALSMLGFGLLAGFLAGTTNAMVPILIIYALELGLPQSAMVQVFNLCFLAGKLAQIIVFTGVGLFGLSEAVSTLPYALAAVVALVAGMCIREWTSTDSYRRLVRVMLFVLALIRVLQFFSPNASGGKDSGVDARDF